jgi:hypothetical protein
MRRRERAERAGREQERLRRQTEQPQRENDRLQRRLDRLERELEAARRVAGTSCETTGSSWRISKVGRSARCEDRTAITRFQVRFSEQFAVLDFLDNLSPRAPQTPFKALFDGSNYSRDRYKSRTRASLSSQSIARRLSPSPP